MQNKLRLTILLLCMFTGRTLCLGSENTFILVHGAWHGDWTYFLLEYELEKAGYEVITINLPGHGLDTTPAANIQLNDYVNSVTQVLDTLSGKAILVGHSMGGIVISATAEVRPQKISKLVYVAAFLLQDGQSMLDIAFTDLNSMILPNIIVDTTNKYIDINHDGIRDIFYSESSEKYVILSDKLLTVEPLIPLATPLSISDTAFGTIPRYYITTTYDQAISPNIQEQMYTALPCRKVYEIHTEHSPFFSNPVLLKNILRKIANDAIIPETIMNNINTYNLSENYY